MSRKEIKVEKIFLKDSSIETPSSPDQFQYEREEVIVKMDMNVRNKLLLAPSYYEVILSLGITGKDQEHFLYIVNVIYGGLFDLKGYNKEEAEKCVAVDCPHILFPYAQQFVYDMTSKSGFHPAFLQPVDFEEDFEDS
jgi:preprotein translocase subunit SecB